MKFLTNLNTEHLISLSEEQLYIYIFWAGLGAIALARKPAYTLVMWVLKGIVDFIKTKYVNVITKFKYDPEMNTAISDLKVQIAHNANKIEFLDHKIDSYGSHIDFSITEQKEINNAMLRELRIMNDNINVVLKNQST